MKQQTPDAVLRPGAEGWELWKFPPKGNSTLEEAFSEKSLDAFANLLLAVPSRSVLSMPLWIASQGDPAELAELELTSRHLLRKDAEVYTVPILEKEGRSLVLALAATDDETAHEYLKKAKCFEIPARLLDPAGADVLVWKEQGALCFAIYREDKCVFFAATGDSNPGAAFCGAIARTAMRLRSESVITRMPAKLRLIGDFLEADAISLGHALRLDFTDAVWSSIPVGVVVSTPSSLISSIYKVLPGLAKVVVKLLPNRETASKLENITINIESGETVSVYIISTLFSV